MRDPRFFRAAALDDLEKKAETLILQLGRVLKEAQEIHSKVMGMEMLEALDELRFQLSAFTLPGYLAEELKDVGIAMHRAQHPENRFKRPPF